MPTPSTSLTAPPAPAVLSPAALEVRNALLAAHPNLWLDWPGLPTCLLLPLTSPLAVGIRQLLDLHGDELTSCLRVIAAVATSGCPAPRVDGARHGS
jgi:hypothetical protein